MLGKLTGWDDTIVALATPPGIGAIAVIRLSGKNAVEIANTLFPSKNLSEQASHSLHVGMLKNGDQLLDEVVLSLYRAPKSYTGEDMVEISCHGSPHVQELILQACISKGARLAKPGEFTQRAFLNGKMDLAQAEAVADLIASHSEASRLSALHTMRGGFSEELKALREQLLGFSALIELELDFSQEDVEFADRSKFLALIGEAQGVTERLIDSFRFGNVIRNGVQVAIVGRPNAGKSTLLNSLLNEQRALVSEIAGTTRDTVEEMIMIEGIQFRLIDTAGIRSHTSDVIESMGMERSREKIEQADIVLQLLDATDDFPEEGLPLEGKKLLRVLNKTDLFSAEELERKLKKWGAVGGDAFSRLSAASLGGGAMGMNDGTDLFPRRRPGSSDDTIGTDGGTDPELSGFISNVKGGRPIPGSNEIICISAKSSAGIAGLKKRLVEFVLSGKTQTEGAIVTNVRHYDALLQVRAALADIRTGLDARLPGDLLSPDIRRALHYLGEITGEISNEEQLSWIFGKFCIGK